MWDKRNSQITSGERVKSNCTCFGIILDKGITKVAISSELMEENKKPQRVVWNITIKKWFVSLWSRTLRKEEADNTIKIVTVDSSKGLTISIVDWYLLKSAIIYSSNESAINHRSSSLFFSLCCVQKKRPAQSQKTMQRRHSMCEIWECRDRVHKKSTVFALDLCACTLKE